MKKTVVFFALLTMAFAGTKSFTISLPETINIGGATLKPGEYQAELQDQKLIIKHGHESAATAVKVETAGKKFSNTSVSYAKENGTNKIESIQVGGTNMKVVIE
jgi:hypothetical protein